MFIKVVIVLFKKPHRMFRPICTHADNRVCIFHINSQYTVDLPTVIQEVFRTRQT